MTDIRQILLAFADHLETYKGLKEIRFDFMVIDFLDGKKRCSVCGEDITSDPFYGLCNDHWLRPSKKESKPMMSTDEKDIENELYKRILKR